MIAYVQDGETALYIASSKSYRAAVELLLQMEHTDVDISTKVYYNNIYYTLCTYIYVVMLHAPLVTVSEPIYYAFVVFISRLNAVPCTVSAIYTCQ